MDPDLLVIGHSFVKQLQVSLLRRGCTTQIVGADLGVSAQFSSVFYHGVGGLKIAADLRARSASGYCRHRH